jgi:hypothetical protein
VDAEADDMARLRDIPGAVADLTLGTVIVLVQSTLLAREEAKRALHRGDDREPLRDSHKAKPSA